MEDKYDVCNDSWNKCPRCENVGTITHKTCSKCGYCKGCESRKG